MNASCRQTVSDRFYQALYEKLLDPEIKTSSKQVGPLLVDALMIRFIQKCDCYFFVKNYIQLFFIIMLLFQAMLLNLIFKAVRDDPILKRIKVNLEECVDVYLSIC